MEKNIKFLLTRSAFLLFILLFLLFTSTYAYAATITVTDNGNSGAGTLRQAFSDANDGDTIDFNLAAGTEIITVESQISTFNKSLTIDGDNTAGSGTNVTVKVTLEGVCTYRTFSLDARSNYDFVLQNMTIQGGNLSASYGEGGAIYFRDDSTGSLTLTNCTITDSKAWEGGALYVDVSDDVTITNCTFQDNAAVSSGSSGGAMYFNTGTGSTITGTVIDNCTAESSGGGIFLSSYDGITIDKCTFSNNSSSVGDGGGMATSNNGDLVAVTITNSTFNGNTAPDTGEDGGAIYFYYGVYVVTNCTFFDNSCARLGGAIFFPYSTLTITNTTIANNASTGGTGDGLYHGSDSTLRIKNCLLANQDDNDYEYFSGTLTNNGYNIVENDSGWSAAGTDITGDQANLHLDTALADNGTVNSTQTLALTDEASVARNAGDTTANSGVAIPTTDQRGFFRLGATDIGAYEYSGTTEATPSTTAPASISQATDGTGYVTFQTTVTDLNDDTCSLEVEYSDDGGSNWYDPDLVSVSGDGTPTVDDAKTFQIESITSTEDDNALTIVWDTLSASNGNGSLDAADQADIQVRVTPSDGTAEGTVQTSESFSVDNLDPTLDSIAWTDSDSSTDISATDILTFTFSETMESGSVDNASGANDVDTVLAPSAGDYGSSGADDLSWTGDTTLVVTLGAGADLSSGATVNPTNAVSDESGNIDNTTSPPAITDNVGSTLESISWTDVDSSTDFSATDTLTFTFSENMSTETIDNSGGANDIDTVLAPSAGDYGSSGASQVSWSDSSTLVVTLGTGINLLSGATVNPTAVASDEAGNADDTTAPGPPIIDNVGPTLESIAWTDSDSSTDISATDILTFTFSKNMSAETIDNSGGANDIDTVLAPSVGNYGASGTANIAWTSDTTLVITLGATATVTSGATVNPTSAVSDEVGNADNTDAPGPSILDNISPTLESIAWTDDDSSGSINVGDSLLFTFSENMDSSTIVSGNIDTMLPLAGVGTTYGGSPTADWSTPSGDNALTVTLGSSVDVDINDRVNPAASVTDAYGNADGTPAPGVKINNALVITSEAGSNGSISPSGTVIKTTNSNQTFTITPDTGYSIDTLLVDGTSTTATTEYTFSNITENHTIEATFAINTFTITSEAGTNGSITPSGITGKNYGSSQTYTITPDSGYGVDTLLVDGTSTTATTEYTFTNITANHTIEASFVLTTVSASTNCVATADSTSQISLSWTNNASVISENNIEQSSNGITFTEIATAASNATSYSATGLTANTRYWHRVRAENSGTYSDYATAEAKYTLAETITSGTSETIGSTFIRVSWEAGSNPSGTQYYCENQTAGTNSGWITNTTWESSSLSSETSYTFRIKARNGDGAETSWYSIGTFTTITKPTPDEVKIGTIGLISGDIIGSTPKIAVTTSVSSSANSVSAKDLTTKSINASSFRIYIDDVLVTDGLNTYYDTVTVVSGVATFEYTPKTPLSEGTHTIRIVFSDSDGVEYEGEYTNLRVMTTVQVVGDPLCYPNPYNPTQGNVRIAYSLGVDTNVTIYIFNSYGEIQWKNSYLSGASGGQAGYNEITWNGRNMFGNYVMNNVYLIRIVNNSNNKMLGKARLAVIK